MTDIVLVAYITSGTTIAVTLLNVLVTLLLKRDVRILKKDVNGRLDELVSAVESGARAEGVAAVLQEQRENPRPRRATDPKPED